MGLYSGGGSHGGGLYGGSGRHASSAPHHEHHGFLHDLVHGPANFAGHLLGDVRDATVGLPMGVVNLAQHPIRSLEEMGKTTWHDWSPLVHGHPGEFLHNFYAHPLAPILDVAAVVTGGAGLVARGASALERAGLAGAAEGGAIRRLAEAGRPVHEVVHAEGAPDAFRHYDHNPAVRLRQQAQVRLGHQLAESAPKWFGTGGKVRDLSDEGFVERFHQKHESYRAGATRAMIHAQLAAFVKAGKDISNKPGKVAVEIEKHGAEQLRDHAMRVTYEQAQKLDMSRYRFVAAKPGALDGTFIKSAQDFENGMETFATRHTTKDISKAAIDAGGQHGGHYLVVHKRSIKAWTDEAKKSATFLTKLYKYPTQAWKYAVLATRPAYFVNNAVGNTFMALASLGPVGFVRGLTDAFRQVHGEERTARSLTGAEKELKKLHGDFQDKWFLGVHQGFGQEAMTTLRLNEKIAGHPRTAKVVRTAEHGLYPITHKVSDVFLRRVMINAIMRRHPTVGRLMHEGHSFDRSAELASRDPAVRDYVQERVNDALGDYHHLNPVEKQVRQFVPFYTWDRAIMRHGVHLALEKPGTAAAMGALGEHGTHETERALGDIPSFMKGLIVLAGHGKGGRSNVIATQGLNPYAAIPDVLDSLGAAVGVGKGRPSEAVASQLNPLITGGIESMTGQSLLSGAKLPHHGGGIVGQTAADIAEGLPHIKLLETLINGEPKPKRNARTGKSSPFLYRKNARAQIAALLGVPVKELNKARAHEMALKESGRKKRRHRSHSSHAGLYG